jgi:hypothetical protein
LKPTPIEEANVLRNVVPVIQPHHSPRERIGISSGDDEVATGCEPTGEFCENIGGCIQMFDHVHQNNRVEPFIEGRALHRPAQDPNVAARRFFSGCMARLEAEPLKLRWQRAEEIPAETAYIEHAAARVPSADFTVR